MFKALMGFSLGLALTLFGAVGALAQSCPTFDYNTVLTPAQWTACFAAKQDALGYTPVNKAGDVMTGRLVLPSPPGNRSGFNITPGSAPIGPIDGDLWVTTAGLYYRANGATVGPLSSPSGGIWPPSQGGTGVNNGSYTITLGGNLTTGGTFNTVGNFATADSFVTNGSLSLPTAAQGDLWYGSASGVMSVLPKSATATRYLANTGASNNPAWAQVNLANGVTGNLAVGNLNGGTSASATTFWRGDGAWGSAVTSIAAGAGLDGGTITTSGTISLSAARRTLPTVTRKLSSADCPYSVPANALWLKVTMVGGGGAGGPSGTGGGSTAGGNTTFGGFTAGGGGGGNGSAGAVGTGGTNSGTLTGAVDLVNQPGGNGTGFASAGTGFIGGNGGQSALFGGGATNGAGGNTAGFAGTANSGGGGSGGSTATSGVGTGGGAGASRVFIINSNLQGSYACTVGAGGTGSAGTIAAGGAGGSGVIIVEEHYNS